MSDARPKTIVPMRRSVRRPRRSPSAPKGSTSAASATVYPSAIHVNCELVAPMSTLIPVSARLTLATEATTSTSARHIDAKIPRRLTLSVGAGNSSFIVLLLDRGREVRHPQRCATYLSNGCRPAVVGVRPLV